MSRSSRKRKYKRTWRPKGAVQCDSRRHRARQRAAVESGDDLPVVETLKHRYNPWNWD